MSAHRQCDKERGISSREQFESSRPRRWSTSSLSVHFIRQFKSVVHTLRAYNSFCEDDVDKWRVKETTGPRMIFGGCFGLLLPSADRIFEKLFFRAVPHSSLQDPSRFSSSLAIFWSPSFDEICHSSARWSFLCQVLV